MISVYTCLFFAMIVIVWKIVKAEAKIARQAEVEESEPNVMEEKL